MKEPIKKIAAIRSLLIRLVRWIKGNQSFSGSEKYWEYRYANGGNSGAGSYGRLAEFKADVINSFVSNNKVLFVIEFGCGDGNQLALASYPRYVGLDVSSSAIEICKKKFENDPTKAFLLYKPLAKEIPALKADLALSLDVIYHLVENRVFVTYMKDLFQASERYVIIYSSNHESKRNHHERTRDVTSWIGRFIVGWALVKVVQNPYPYESNDPDNTSQSHFFIYEKSTGPY